MIARLVQRWSKESSPSNHEQRDLVLDQIEVLMGFH
jgi:hypothetical protein